MDGPRYIVSRLSIKLSGRERYLIDCDGFVRLIDTRREHIIITSVKPHSRTIGDQSAAGRLAERPLPRLQIARKSGWRKGRRK